LRRNSSKRASRIDAGRWRRVADAVADADADADG
jgi:endogenous inhibitor of DNA gyrase (YacG/DUF329 family)